MEKEDDGCLHAFPISWAPNTCQPPCCMHACFQGKIYREADALSPSLVQTPIMVLGNRCHQFITHDALKCPKHLYKRHMIDVFHIWQQPSSTLAWKIRWTEEPGRLQSMGSLRVGHDWATSLSLFTFMHWRRKWQPTPVFLPGEAQGQGSLVGFRLWGRTVRHDWSDLAAAAAEEIPNITNNRL